MLKRFCDRCKSEIPPAPSTAEYFRYHVTIHKVRDLSWDIDPSRAKTDTTELVDEDLCRDCWSEVSDVLRRKPKGGH